MSLLARTRTDQTLWLHSLARLVAPHQSPTSPPLSLSALSKLAQPSIRLTVLSALPLAHGEWAASRALLLHCRLVLPSPTTEAVAATDDTGLVLLSLHSHPPSSALHGGPPRKKTPTGGGATLIVPTTAVDLGMVTAGVEVWAWDPTYEVVRPAAGGRMLRVKAGERAVVGTEGEVVFDPRPADERERERAERRARDDWEERAERALVCPRFAIVC